MRACDVRGSRYRVSRQVGGWIAEPGERKVQVMVQVMGTEVLVDVWRWLRLFGSSWRSTRRLQNLLKATDCVEAPNGPWYRGAAHVVTAVGGSE